MPHLASCSPTQGELLNLAPHFSPLLHYPHLDSDPEALGRGLVEASLVAQIIKNLPTIQET